MTNKATNDGDASENLRPESTNDEDLTTDDHRRNSGKKLEDKSRSGVYLVVAIDSSGSMALPLGENYGGQHIESSEESNASKLEILGDWLDHIVSDLNNRDEFSLVRFNTAANVVIDSSGSELCHSPSFREQLDQFQVASGANLYAGFEKAAELMTQSQAETYAHRHIIFISDSLPSAVPARSPVIKLMRKVADDNLSITYIGIDCEPTMELSETFSGLDGITQQNVHSRSDLADVELSI